MCNLTLKDFTIASILVEEENTKSGSIATSLRGGGIKSRWLTLQTEFATKL